MSPALSRASRRAIAITAYCRTRHGTLPAQLATEAPAILRVAIAEVDGILAILDCAWIDAEAPRPLPSTGDITAIERVDAGPASHHCPKCGIGGGVEGPLHQWTCQVCGTSWGQGSAQ